DNGFADIWIFFSQANDFLNLGGLIFFEDVFTEAVAITALFSQCNFNDIKIVTDLNNNDRCTKAHLGYL
ncbi:peptide chain release factor N(5)-glutamine methyltransferase, partial [Francisella tularensis subsp. holarctica]|nr:peptide chain release factor N(5)-glutamine methyltransferase [Francisella tularensis subsp. holarctica]